MISTVSRSVRFNNCCTTKAPSASRAVFARRPSFLKHLAYFSSNAFHGTNRLIWIHRFSGFNFMLKVFTNPSSFSWLMFPSPYISHLRRKLFDRFGPFSLHLLYHISPIIPLFMRGWGFFSRPYLKVLSSKGVRVFIL